MKVGVIGPSAPDDFADNILDALPRLGCEAVGLGSAFPTPKGFATRAAVDLARKVSRIDVGLQRKLVENAREQRCDVIVSVESLAPPIVAELTATTPKVALWFPDHVGNLGRHMMFVAPYSALFFKQPRLVERARALLDAPVHYLPEACNPTWHRPPPDVEKQRFLVMAGTLYPWRVRLLERLAAAGLPLRIYGLGIPRWLSSPVLEAQMQHRYVVREEKAAIFRAAAGVLNTLHPAEVDGHNARLFEAAGCGAAVITEARPELVDVFDPESEVVTYSDGAELIDVCSRLLDDPGYSTQIGDAAAARAHADHTYEQRLRTMLSLLT